jgi:hypothetical protein
MTVGVHQMTAPLRFFFFIQPENESRFKRAMELAYLLWGGLRSPIFPFFNELPKSYRLEFDIDIATDIFYKNTIENYDPDIILFDEDLDRHSILSLAGDRLSVEIGQYLSDFYKAPFDKAVSILDIAEYLSDKEFKYQRSDKLKIVIPKMDGNSLLLQAFLGKCSDEMEIYISRLFQNKGVCEQADVNWSTLEEFRNVEKIDILFLNNYELKTLANKRYKIGSCLYFLRENRLQDIINFWNLRAAGWQILPIPIEQASLPYFSAATKRFIDRLQENSSHVWLNTLIGYQIQEQELAKAFNQVKPNETEYSKEVIFPFQQWFPRFWASYTILDADSIKSHTPYYENFFDHYETNEGYLKIRLQTFPFNKVWPFSRKEAYKVVLSLSLQDEYSDFAGFLTGINTKQLKRLIQPFDFSLWRISSVGIHRSIDRTDDKIHFSVAKSLDFFKSYFGNKSYNLNETPNSKLSKQVLKNIGGLLRSRFLLRPANLKIIESFEGGNDVHYSDLLAEIKKQTNLKNNDAKYFIKRLLDNKIIELGAKIRCSVCEQSGFILPHQISATITCPVCRNTYDFNMHQPMEEISWSYRGIGPFTRTNKADGVFAVFAVLNFFHSEFVGIDGKISSLIGFDLVRSGKNSDGKLKEVDIGLIFEDRFNNGSDPNLLLCECKTYKYFDERDIERMKSLGDEFPGSILTLATLNESLTEVEAKLITGLVKYFQRGEGSRPRNSILILTGKELLPSGYHNAFEQYEKNIKPYHYHNDFIGTMCELTIKNHLKIKTWGDIKEEAWRVEINRRQQIGNIVKALKDRFG